MASTGNGRKEDRSGRTIDILLADDDEEFRRSFRRNILNGYGVTEVADADGLVEEARRGGYALIITDNRMEDGHEDSGIYAIREIRRFDAGTPIILQSASVDERLRQRAIDAGASAVLSKISARIADYRRIIEEYTDKGG